MTRRPGNRAAVNLKQFAIVAESAAYFEIGNARGLGALHREFCARHQRRSLLKVRALLIERREERIRIHFGHGVQIAVERLRRKGAIHQCRNLAPRASLRIARHLQAEFSALFLHLGRQNIGLIGLADVGNSRVIFAVLRAIDATRYARPGAVDRPAPDRTT